MNIASHSPNTTTPGHLNKASLLGGASVATDGSPLFQDALDRIAEACGPGLDKIAGDGMQVTCALMSLTTETAGDVMAQPDPLTIAALFEAPAANARLLVGLEHDMLQLVIEMMCGGICGEPLPDTPRTRTSIDRQFARVFLNLLATTIEKSCHGFGLGPVSFGQIETKLDPLSLGKRNAKVSLATYVVECLGRRATFRVAFPQTIVDRFKQDALPSGAETLAADPAWTERFTAEIRRTVVRLDACLDASRLTLGQVAAFKVGDIIPLPKSASARCELRSDKKVLFRCDLGQVEGRYCLRIEETIPSEVSSTATKASEASAFSNLS